MDIWHWVYEFQWEIEDNGDSALQQMVDLSDRAFELTHDDPAASFALFEQSRALAAQHQQKWWELFCEHWKLQVLIHHLRDYKTALDVAARAAIEARKPIYTDLPQRVCVHEDLISTYNGIDPAGYAPLIRDALAYMEREIRPGVECERCHQGLRATFLTQLGDREAIDAAWNYWRLADQAGDIHHAAGGAGELCWALYVCDPDAARERLGEIAEAGEAAAREDGESSRDSLLELLLWRALAACWAGSGDASRFYQQAMRLRERQGSVSGAPFFAAAIAFHEAGGDWEKALQIVDEELAVLEGHGQIWREAQARVKKCELLAELGRDWQQEAQKTREIAARLKDASALEKRLKKIR